ncbi:MAG: HEAT repeat domain-containing protein [Planctomycetota bacterium]|nr:HEAT repeat domain-containing protein [Planctomycetota bacterium]
MMLLCVGATITLAGIAGPESATWPKTLSVGVTTSLVLALWSAVLAMRAFRTGERSAWPLLVMFLCVLEVVLFGLACLIARLSHYGLYDWTIMLGLPVFLPVACLAALIAVPVAWWRARRAAKRQAARNKTPWNSTQRWKRGLAWFCAVAVLVCAVALPVPLFVFCATVSASHWPGVTARWHRWAVVHTPPALGEWTAGILSRSRLPSFVPLYAAVLESGRVSGDRLVSELNAADPNMAFCALNGLWATDRERVFDLVGEAGRGAIAFRNSSLENYMGKLAGWHGGPEAVERYLDPAQGSGPRTEFLLGLLAAAGPGKRAQFLRKLERLCDSDSPNREAALRRLAQLGEPDRIERLWARYLADKNVDRRRQAIASISFIQSPNAALNVLATGLESHDLATRREMMRNIDELFLSGYEVAAPAVVARVARALLPLLDEEDLATRQDAAWGLAALIKASELDKRVRTIIWTEGGKPLAPLTPEARKLTDDLRAAVRKWLETR